jgi:hypothetical protein
MRVIRIEQQVAVWERSRYDVPVPDHLSDEEARGHALKEVASGAWAPWHVEVGDLVDGGPNHTSAVGPLGLISATASDPDLPHAA